MSTSYTPPPPAVAYGDSTTPTTAVRGGTSSSSASIVTVIIIIASAIILSASIYLLLRYLSRRIRHPAAADVVIDASPPNPPRRHAAAAARDEFLDSLPLFTFRSVTPGIAGGDCAVCLSKFEPHDQLRLLPLCCHAFHAACIDAWIITNQTCPLCRSTVLPSGGDALDKILLSAENRGKVSNRLTDSNVNGNGNGNSFRIEIGDISPRRAGESDLDAATEEDPSRRRSYSVGSFDYILNDNGYEVSVGSTTHSRQFSDFDSNEKEPSVGVPMPPPPPGEVLAAEDSGGGNRLRECVDRLASVSSSSRTMSFRSSSRFFSGSSRRSDDLEAYRAGEEISEIFRWLSGV